MNCFLCGKNGDIQLSHILPKCLCKKFRKDARYKILKRGEKKYIQDLNKYFLLCHNCEERFSIFENKFYKHVYQGIKSGKEEIFIYNDTRYFVLSLLWRVLYECVYKHDIGNLDINCINRCKKKIDEYKSILLSNDFDFSDLNLSIIPIKWIENPSIKKFPFDKLIKYQIRESLRTGLFIFCLVDNIIFILNLERDFLFNKFNICTHDIIRRRDISFNIPEIDILLDEILNEYNVKI